MLKTDNAFPQRLEGIVIDEGISLISISDGAFSLDYIKCKPYLRPLSSMTEEEKEEYNNLRDIGTDECSDIIYFDTSESID